MKTLLLIDGTSYLYRAFHAMAPLSSPSGEPTGALFGVLNMLKRLPVDFPHDYAACVFDAKGPTFRNEMYPDYKATRPPMPDELRSQAAQIQDLVAQMGWPVLSVTGVEADDVIGSLAVQAEAQGCKVIISTGDKDMAQLVTPHIMCVNTMNGDVLDEAGVKDKFGVRPDQIIDYLTLIGDKVDNVPGVDKVGPKTAVKWLEQYDSLDNVIANAADIKGKVGEHLQAALDHLPLSKQLITIKTDMDFSQELPNHMADLSPKSPAWSDLVTRFTELGFKRWLAEAEQQASKGTTADLFAAPAAAPVTKATPAPTAAFKPEHQLGNEVERQYQAILTQEALQALLNRLQAAIDGQQAIAIDTETTSLSAMDAQLVGISIAFGAGDAVYIPLAHTLTAVPDQLDLDATLNALKPFLENAALGKIGQNIKYDQHIFANYGIALQGVVADTMLLSYVLESHLGHGMDELAERHLGITTISYESLCGKGAKQISFADVALDDALAYAAEDADITWRLNAVLWPQLDAKQRELYEQVELPVEQVLWQMERTGVLIDKAELDKQSHELGSQILALENDAYQLAGQPFNLNSPKQLQEILFDKLAIPTTGLKKTASGGISTNEAVLEKLAPKYDLPKIILQNRSLTKLKSTYTDKLPQLIRADTGRVHTTYAQAVAITGRLASNNPNLQNIPIRTAEGRRVRQAFIAPAGHKIISADYSQVELRIMAHLSGDATLIDAFNKGEDVHRRTAAEVFHVKPEDVSSEQRRYAKTINFGLIYGMGQYGLANNLEITPAEAQEFINRYFARYPAVAEYMQAAKDRAHEQGYVETIMGRRLYLPDIANKNGNIRAGAERAAINAPMQGTASDLIKRAMILVAAWLQADALRTRLLMQVHDELVLEVPEDEIDLVSEQLPRLMAQAGNLKVPLVAEVGIGMNWDEAH
ncbi:DNA polymerase I [Vitreoscilla massiliensis]|uniref:DNA polymerase I n=1 Tax=Vitreoscilla massiliensis TaxID=1689272 RepID=A0ABY4DWJ0_9NEIS|nr:DNA polymerase I [Vitreoscilla massiliensis]UOO87879.1 DNA polymerase I [Vitreoscilla massiliensis]